MNFILQNVMYFMVESITAPCLSAAAPYPWRPCFTMSSVMCWGGGGGGHYAIKDVGGGATAGKGECGQVVGEMSGFLLEILIDIAIDINLPFVIENPIYYVTWWHIDDAIKRGAQ